MSDLRGSPDGIPRQPTTDVLLLLRGDLALGRQRAVSRPRCPSAPGQGHGIGGRARAAQGMRREIGMGKQFSLKPLEDRVVVKADEGDETTASGIVIPDTAKERPQEGEVMSAGPGRFEDGQRTPMDVKAGDKVIYSKYGGTEVKVRDDEYLILSARDVLAGISNGREGSSQRRDGSP